MSDKKKLTAEETQEAILVQLAAIGGTLSGVLSSLEKLDRLKETDFGDAIAAHVQKERESFVRVKRELGFTYPGIDEEFPGTEKMPSGIVDVHARTREDFFAEFVLVLRLRLPSDIEGRAFKVVEATADSLSGYFKNLGGQESYSKSLTTLNPDQIVGFSTTQG